MPRCSFPLGLDPGLETNPRLNEALRRHRARDIEGNRKAEGALAEAEEAQKGLQKSIFELRMQELAQQASDLVQQRDWGQAKAVYDRLIAMGSASRRISFKGFGMSRPVVENSSIENKAKNRRIEFAIVN